MAEPMNDSLRRRESVLASAIAVLLLAVLVTSHAVSGVFAKYTTEGSAMDTARVALFGHSESIDLSGWTADLKPGDTRSIKLEVSNAKSDGTVSEVAQAYDIEVETAGNLPLTYTLACDRQTVGSFDEKATASHTFSSDDMAFKAGVKKSASYTLNVSWPSGKNGSEYADIPDYVQVHISVRQID